MKDIKSLYEAAKNSGSQTDITAYSEAVNELFESKPSDFISNLKYIITSDIGCSRLDSFVEKWGLSIAAYQPIVECLNECIEKCKEKKIDSSVYESSLEKIEAYREKYHHCFDMFDYYSEGLFNKPKQLSPEELKKLGIKPIEYKKAEYKKAEYKKSEIDDSKKKYLESYYGFNKDGIQNNKLIVGLVKEFGEAAIADALITANRIDSIAVGQVLEYVQSICESRLLSQWICECANDVNIDHQKSKDSLVGFRSASLDHYIESMRNDHQIYMREALILGDSNSSISYTNEDIQSLQDMISFKEYQIVCSESVDEREKLQKDVYSLYEEFDGMEPYTDNTNESEPFQEDMSWRNTRNKKTGKAPSYLSTNHDIGYGEDDGEKSLNDFKRASVSDDNDDNSNVSDDEFDDDPDANGDMTVEDRKAATATNNYYYYTYNNSLNKNSNSFNKNDDHSVDNSVDNSRKTSDDHSTGKHINSHNGTPHTEGFLGNLFSRKKKKQNENDTIPSSSNSVRKYIPIAEDEKNEIMSKYKSLVNQISAIVKPISDKYPIYGLKINVDDDCINNLERSLEVINKSGQYGVYVHNDEIDLDAEIELSGFDQYDFMTEFEKDYPDEVKQLTTKYDINNRYDWTDIHWCEKICGYDKTLNEITDEISSIIKSQFNMISDWEYWGDNDSGPLFGGHVDGMFLYPNFDVTKAITESKDPTELDIFGGSDSPNFFTESLYNNEFEVYVDCCEAVETILSESFMESTSDPRFKYAYKAAYDFNTGHAIKITYSLDPITITNVGVAKPIRDEILSIVNKTSEVANEKSMFKAILTAVNGIIKSKRNIEMRKTVLTEILNKYIDQVGYVDFQAKDCKIVSITDRYTKEKLRGPIDIVGVYAAADLNSERSLALSPYNLKRMQDRVKRRGSNFRISSISVGDIQTIPTFMSTYWDRNCDKGLVNQNGDVILDDDMDRDNLSQIISSREIQGFDIDTKNSRFSDGLGDFIDPIRSIGDSKKNKMFKKFAYDNSIRFIRQAEDVLISANKIKKQLINSADISPEDISSIDGFINSIDDKLSQANKHLSSDNHEEVYNVLNVPETINQQYDRFKELIDQIQAKYEVNVKLEAVGDADDNKPESDHPVKDILTDIDQKRVKNQQAMKKKVQDAQNVVRAATKPINRTKDWVTNIVNDWKDKDENAIKEKMADPKARKNIFTAIGTAIKAGSLLKAGLLLNPVFLALAGLRKIGNDKNKMRLRDEMIGELKTELEVIDEKIEDARNNRDNKEKYQLMRLRNEINKKLVRVSGSVSNKKWVKGGIV